MWTLSHRAHEPARLIADRHYNRQKPGTRQFVPPGRCLVLMTPERDALWVSSWPFARYVKHQWAGAWICSCFRREPGCRHRASELVECAVAATREIMSIDPPGLGFVTFVDPRKVRPTMVRGQAVYGFCYRKAGWHECGWTKGGLIALRQWPHEMPDPEAPLPFARPARKSTEHALPLFSLEEVAS